MPGAMPGPMARQGVLGGTAFTILVHDPARPLRPQRDAVATAVPGLLGLGAAGLVLRRRPGRKPLLEGGEKVGCSIAHCGHLSLLGVRRGHEVGVDLEAVRTELPLHEVAAAFFTAREAGWLRALPARQRPLATTLLWSAKEAWLKATGTGITAGLHTPVLDRLDLEPLLDGRTEAATELDGGILVSLRHGTIGSSHLVMAVVSFPECARLACRRGREPAGEPGPAETPSVGGG